MNEYVYVMDCLLRRVFFCIADFCASVLKGQTANLLSSVQTW